MHASAHLAGTHTIGGMVAEALRRLALPPHTAGRAALTDALADVAWPFEVEQSPYVDPASLATASSLGMVPVAASSVSRKVLTLCFNHETNTFSSQPTTRADFEQRGLLMGQAIDDAYRGTATEIGGFIQRGEELELELVHVIYARAQPAGLVADEVAELVWSALSEALDNHPDTAGVLLALHGALITETHDDGEGFILERLRRKVGPDMPLIATLDLHAHCSATMVESASALIGYKTYPHVDYVERAVEATDLMASMIAGESHPTMAMVKPPMIPMVGKQFTGQGTAREMIEKLVALEAQDSVISATLIMGFPWADVHDMGCAFVVVTEDDLGLAERIAAELSEEMWARRAEFMPDLLTPAQAVAEAVAERGAGRRPVVMPDMSVSAATVGLGCDCCRL